MTDGMCRFERTRTGNQQSQNIDMTRMLYYEKQRKLEGVHRDGSAENLHRMIIEDKTKIDRIMDIVADLDNSSPAANSYKEKYQALIDKYNDTLFRQLESEDAKPQMVNAVTVGYQRHRPWSFRGRESRRSAEFDLYTASTKVRELRKELEDFALPLQELIEQRQLIQALVPSKLVSKGESSRDVDPRDVSSLIRTASETSALLTAVRNQRRLEGKVVPPLNIETIARQNDTTVHEVQRNIDHAKKAMTPYSQYIEVTEGSTTRQYTVERKGVGTIKNEYGTFHEYLFHIDDNWQRYNVIVKADLDDNFQPILKDPDQSLVVRIDSGCETGQLFGDVTCDCRPQLFKAMETIREVGEGIIVNIPNQDGRGMGLPFKLSTLTLQEEMRMDTIQSASALAPDGVIDVRTYAGVAAIIKFFGIPNTTSINLATNNPWKEDIFKENGYRLAGTVPIVIEATNDTRRHFKAKGKHLGHRGLIPGKEG